MAKLRTALAVIAGLSIGTAIYWLLLKPAVIDIAHDIEHIWSQPVP